MTTFDHLRGALSEIPQLYVMAREMIRPGVGKPSEVHVKQVHAPLPIDGRADELCRETALIVGSWAAVLRDDMGLYAKPARRQHIQVEQDCLFLSGCISLLLEFGPVAVSRWQGGTRTETALSGREGAQEIVRVAQTLKAFAGAVERRRRAPIPCPRCSGRLWMIDGADRVECDRGCQAMTQDEYRESVKAFVGMLTRNEAVA